MWIQGFQKLSLLDYPEKMAATLFTAGCNFRCPFCHNASLVTYLDPSQRQNNETILAYLKKRRNLLNGVCISGGEPLLQPDIIDFLGKIKAMGYDIKLDTNGSDAQLLQYVIQEKLVDYVALDIKNAPNKYPQTIGVSADFLADILQSVELLLSGACKYEFRTTVVRDFHKREDMEIIGKWIAGAKAYYLQEFINSGDLITPGLSGYDRYMMVRIRDMMLSYIPNTQIRFA